MEDLSHKLLNFVEGLGLSEGEYLQACDVLKHSFGKFQKQKQPIFIPDLSFEVQNDEGHTLKIETLYLYVNDTQEESYMETKLTFSAKGKEDVYLKVKSKRQTHLCYKMKSYVLGMDAQRFKLTFKNFETLKQVEGEEEEALDQFEDFFNRYLYYMDSCGWPYN